MIDWGNLKPHCKKLLAHFAIVLFFFSFNLGLHGDFLFFANTAGSIYLFITLYETRRLLTAPKRPDSRPRYKEPK